MASSNKPNPASAPAINRLTADSKHLEGVGQIPVVLKGRLAEVSSLGATRMSGHKGNVLLEDIQPGQRVLFNATFLLKKPFVFEPTLDELQHYTRVFTKHLASNKDGLIMLYSRLCRDVQNVDPMQLHATAIKRNAPVEELNELMKNCEKLAVIKLLCFGEPMPLIDVATFKKEDQGQGGETSSTKARKIGQPFTSQACQADAAGDQGRAKPSNTEDGAASGVTSAIPCMVLKGKGKVVYACFHEELQFSNGCFLNPEEVLNTEGMLCTTTQFVQKYVENFKKRVTDETTALQQEYRDAFQACIQFINKEGTARSKDEWVEFISNCVHVHALRHVLHGKPLSMYNKPGQSAAVDDLLKSMFDIIETKAANSNKKNTRAYVNSGQSLSFAELEKMEDITVYINDCLGMPDDVICKVITDGYTLKDLRKRSETICRDDISAAKLFFSELTKACRKSPEELAKLQDMAKIGEPKAVKGIQRWTNDCLYWCVLRKVLHNVPIKLYPGRAGTPVEGGVSVPGDIDVVIYG